MSSTRATRTRRTRRRSIVDLSPTFQRGRPQPLGATVDDGGVNFALFSEEATGVELLLFDSHNDLQPVATIPFDPVVNRSFHFWHMYVTGLDRGLPLRLPRPRAEPAAGIASTTRRCCSTPTRRATRTRSGSPATPACPATTSSRRCAPSSSTTAATTGRATSRSSGRWRHDRLRAERARLHRLADRPASSIPARSTG